METADDFVTVNNDYTDHDVSPLPTLSFPSMTLAVPNAKNKWGKPSRQIDKRRQRRDRAQLIIIAADVRESWRNATTIV